MALTHPLNCLPHTCHSLYTTSPLYEILEVVTGVCVCVCVFSSIYECNSITGHYIYIPFQIINLELGHETPFSFKHCPD